MSDPLKILHLKHINFTHIPELFEITVCTKLSFYVTISQGLFAISLPSFLSVIILIFPEPFVHFWFALTTETLIMVYFIESQYMFVAWPFLGPYDRVSHSYKSEFLDYKWQVEELGFGPQFPKITSMACHLYNNTCRQAVSFATSCKMSIIYIFETWFSTKLHRKGRKRW